MDSRRSLISAHLTCFMDDIKDDFVKEKIIEIRNALIESLLDDGTIYSIIYSLRDLQLMREKKLFDDRQHEISNINNKNGIEERIKEIDKKIFYLIEETVKEQQSTLCCSGVPFFKVTDECKEIQIQMSIIQFILSLSHIFEKESLQPNL